MNKLKRQAAAGTLIILITALFGCLISSEKSTSGIWAVFTQSKAEASAINEMFYSSPITDDIWKRIYGKSYKENCPLPVEDLRYLHLLHKDLNGKTKEGEMVCNAHIADTLLEIFRELYAAGYRIEKIRLVDEYGADDETSMRDNNSSCFNFRFISGTKKISKHGLGLAVDINTLYNPYVKEKDGKIIVEPATATEYIDRTKDFPCKITRDDLCFKLFTEHGFEWGGDWKTVKDYQHFELPTEEINKLYPENK